MARSAPLWVYQSSIINENTNSFCHGLFHALVSLAYLLHQPVISLGLNIHLLIIEWWAEHGPGPWITCNEGFSDRSAGVGGKDIVQGWQGAGVTDNPSTLPHHYCTPLLLCCHNTVLRHNGPSPSIKTWDIPPVMGTKPMSWLRVGVWEAPLLIHHLPGC